MTNTNVGDTELGVEAATTPLTSSEEVILDPEAASDRLAKAMEGILIAAQYTVGSCPYGLIPDPHHVAVLRDAVKRYQLCQGEVESTAVLIRMAGQEFVQQGHPTDIQTEGM